MKYVVIGSVALKFNLSLLGIDNNLNCTDTDILCVDKLAADIFINKLKDEKNPIEFVESYATKKFNTTTDVYKIHKPNKTEILELSYPTNNEFTTTLYLLDYVLENSKYTTSIYGINCYVTPLDCLYTLKMSHRFLKDSPHFLKTMKHFNNMQKLGAKVFDTEWLRLRELETYDYSHPNLNVKKDDFFNSNFNYIYDHDSIHEAVKYMNEPAYKYYMHDGADVSCSKGKFFECSKSTQLLGVLEETYVLALERSQIPTNFKVDPEISFTLALEKVCTSITSGWFRDFAYENYDIILKLFDKNYVKSFTDALQSGKILPYKTNGV